MRGDEETEAVVRRRLAHLVGAQPTGWTPEQPDIAPRRPAVDGPPRWLVAPHLPALRWLFVAGAAVVVAAYVLLHHSAGAAPAAPPVSVPAATTVATPSAQIVVDVGGRVRHPGLVSLPAGSRVADAIAAAGGALHPADLTTVNLAARVSDGQLLLVGVAGAGIGTGGAASGPLDLNGATVDQLDALPGVGPVLARRIVDWRQQHGGFGSIDDLQQVPGIGARKFADLKALVTV